MQGRRGLAYCQETNEMMEAAQALLTVGRRWIRGVVRSYSRHLPLYPSTANPTLRTTRSNFSTRDTRSLDPFSHLRVHRHRHRHHLDVPTAMRMRTRRSIVLLSCCLNPFESLWKCRCPMPKSISLSSLALSARERRLLTENNAITQSYETGFDNTECIIVLTHRYSQSFVP